MNRTRRAFSYTTALLILCAGLAFAQRGGGRRAATANAPPARVIAIPVGEAANMLQQMRVWVFTPPAGASAYGLGGLGDGQRIWALLPSCRQANPDDPRDPCPISHVAIELITGTGDIHGTDPQPISTQSTRRVQSFVVPSSAGQVRVKLVRQDNGVRYEAAVWASQLVQLPAPEGQPTSEGFGFDLARYPSR